jgi:hypothetical protein
MVQYLIVLEAILLAVFSVSGAGAAGGAARYNVGVLDPPPLRDLLMHVGANCFFHVKSTDAIYGELSETCARLAWPDSRVLLIVQPASVVLLSAERRRPPPHHRRLTKTNSNGVLHVPIFYPAKLPRCTTVDRI